MPRQSRIPGARRAIVVAMAAGVAAIALAGCGAADKGEPAAEGTVSSVQDAGDPFVFVLSSDPQSALNNAIITVDAKNIEGADPADIARGDEVKVWAEVCTASIPAQCQATAVEVVGR
jgi:hypothetical protein